jgi:murein DD-endopeptidase MepM/ murein hydrolase activator NlpD
MIRERGGLPAIVLVIIALGGFGFLLAMNAQPSTSLVVVVPTEGQPTQEGNSWPTLLHAGFGSNSTPLPTVAVPTGEFVAPTLERGEDSNLIPLAPEDVSGGVLPTFTPFDAAVTPTLPAPTAAIVATDVAVTARVVTQPPAVWQPPPLVPPLSRDPLGRDHYWFIRPVDSNATNFGLFYYPYGSDGPEREAPWRIHSGIDMPNPIGETVRAAGSGTVVWAADGLRVEGGIFQNTYSYGNVVVIQHDFGYRGQALFTLYAHLSAVLVTPNQLVNAGDVIGLIGDSGRVSGPHVHFEVRLGENVYGSTFNPVLWMVPYVGRGVIAGRVVDEAGDLLQDHVVTIRDWGTGLVTDATTTYIYNEEGSNVNADPIWQENFAVGDVPIGRYEVITQINGNRISKIVEVLEGTTTYIDLEPVQPATALPVSDGE